MTQETEGMKLWLLAEAAYEAAWRHDGPQGEQAAAAIIDKALAERDATIAEQAKQIEALRGALQGISEFGERHPGHGYSCYILARAALGAKP